MGFQQDFLHVLEQAKDKCKTVTELSKITGINQGSLSRLFGGEEKTFNQKVIARALDALGAKLIFPDKNATLSREVYFVDVKAPMAREGELPVDPENYTAVPLLSDAGAGPGVIWNEYERPKEWFLVNRRAQSMRGRNAEKFFAVRVDSRSTSMEPTLHPGDTVLIDPTDIRVESPGGIFLVMDPEGSVKIKRVNLESVPAHRLTRLTFYSDNVAEYPPEVRTLENDYGNDLSRAIIGRVIWAWSDLSKK